MAKKDNIQLPPIQFVLSGDTPEEQEEKLDLILPAPGFPAAAQLIAEAIEKRSEVSVLDFTAQAVSIRFQIDGIWHTMPPMDRETGDYMMAALKQMADMNYRDRRSRQEGKFKANYLRHKHDCRLVSQGVKTGERIAMYLNIKKPKTETLVDCGMREKMQEKLQTYLNRNDKGLTLISAMPGEGYTTAWTASLTAADRFMRDYYVLEEVSRVEEEVINITSITFDESKGETAFSPIPQLLLKEPNVLLFAELPNGKTLDMICDLSNQEDMPMITRVHGKHALDATLRLLLIGGDANKVLELLQVVLNMRLIRKLCENCRIPYTPNPGLLQKLGLPQGRVNRLYQAFVYQPGMVDERGKEIDPCPECQGLGFHGLTGLFELLEITPQIRKALLETPKMNVLTKLTRQQRHVSIRDEGILLVAKGVTSIEELQRVLRK